MIKNPPAKQETWVRSLGREDPLEEEMATHSSILVWKIPQTEELGRLQYAGSQSWTGLNNYTFFLLGKIPRATPSLLNLFFLIEGPFLLSSHESVPAS